MPLTALVRAGRARSLSRPGRESHHWSACHRSWRDKADRDHVVKQGGQQMRIAAPQTPRLLLPLDELGNDSPRCLRPAPEPGVPERGKRADYTITMRWNV